MSSNYNLEEGYIGDIEKEDYEMFIVLNQARLSVFEQFHFDIKEQSTVPMYVKEDRSIHLVMEASFQPFVMVNMIGGPDQDIWCNYKIELKRERPGAMSWLEISLITAEEVLQLETKLQKKGAVEVFRLNGYESHLATRAMCKTACATRKLKRKSRTKARRKSRK